MGFSKHWRHFVIPAALVALTAIGGCSAGSSSSTMPPGFPNADQSGLAVPQVGARTSESQDGIVAQLPAVAPVPMSTGTPIPVAYVTGYYTTTSGTNTSYQSVVYSYNTQTNAFAPNPIIKTPGLPSAATLSGDGQTFFLSLPIVSATQSNQSGTLDAYTVSPTGATKIGSLTYPSGDFDLGYAGITTGASAVADVFKNTQTVSTFDVDSPALSVKEVAPGIASPVQYAVVAPGTGVQNSYFVDRAGNFRVYNAATNTYSNALAGVTSAVSTGLPVIAVLPNGSQVYGLALNRSGSGSTTVDVINPTTVKITKQITLPYLSYEVIADSASKNVYVIGETETNDVLSIHISQIAVSTNTVTKSFTLPDSTVRTSPVMAVSPDDTNLLFTVGTGSAAADGDIDVVSASTGALVKKVALPLGPNSAPVVAQEIFTQR